MNLSNYENLIPISSQKKLVLYAPSDIEIPLSLRRYVETALEQYRNCTSIPYLIYDKLKNTYAGSTRYMNINRKNKVLHIGSTGLGNEFNGTGLNQQLNS